MNLWDSIEAMNGEIRLQAVRYGRGWYCLIVTYDVDECGVWERWEDLIGGDIEWAEAERYFKSAGTGIHLAIGTDPRDALETATVMAERERAGE